MDFDSEILEKIKAMDSGLLDAKLNEISGIMGIERSRINRFFGDADGIKEKISRLSSEDVKRMVQTIDPKKLEDIKNSLEGK